MPTNKNAFIRYKYLDRLLSDRHHCYDRKMLWEKVNEMLYDAGFKEVTRRCIETDIENLIDALLFRLGLLEPQHCYAETDK